MSASKLQTETPTPFDVLANASSFLAPELLHSSATHDSCFPPSHSSDTNGNGSTKAFHPPIDQWKPLVAQDAKGVGPYSVHRHETRFLLRCDFPGLKLESLYRLLTETTRRGQWDAKLENARVVETLESPLNAIVEYYKLSGTFPIIKQRELVLLSCSATLPSSSEDKQQIIGASTSIDHPDVPPSRTHMRFYSSLSGFVFTGTPTGVHLMQMQDFGPLANYVPSSALRLALTAILPKTLLSFKNGALSIPSSGSLDFLPPRIDSWREDAIKQNLYSAATGEQTKEAPPSTVEDETAQKAASTASPAIASPVNNTIPCREGSQSDTDALLTLQSPTVNATIDPQEKRLSYFEVAGNAERQPQDDQKQQWLAQVLSTDEGLRALNRLSKAVPDSHLTVEGTLMESSELLATPGLSDSGTMTASMSSDDVEQESKLMEDLAEAIGVQMKVVDEDSQDHDQVRQKIEVKPQGQESQSTVSWVTSTAGKALKTASYTVYG